jgi:enoyl-CoA hydratase/carnithine racemase
MKSRIAPKELLLCYDGRVNLSIEGLVARVTLSRPEQHNAIEAQDVARLHAHLATIRAHEDVRVLVLTGTGNTFCAGVSLSQIASGEVTGEMFEGLADDLARIRVPSVCALNGSTFGGGAELALCCDFRIGVVGSRMAVPPAKLGIAYPLGGIRRYVAALGLGVATRLLLGAEELDAELMLRVGFLHRLVERSELEAATRDLVDGLVASAPLAVQTMKRLLRDVAAGTVDEAEARRLIDRCAKSEDLAEGLAARLEGRAPRFRGR